MKITKKSWESNFLQRDIYAISLGERTYRYSDIEQIKCDLETLQQQAPSGLYEFELDARYLFLSPAFESAGFRLWDSKFQFITTISKKKLPRYDYDLPTSCTIQPYKPVFRDQVLALNEEYLITDDQLVSKWKSPYFDIAVTFKWFTTWVNNSIDGGAKCSLLIQANEVKGFFIYALGGEYRKQPLYKGVLSAIDPAFRGRNLHLALQEFISNELIEQETFCVDNTTQISNIPIIKNHFNSRRNPSSIRLIFLWEKID